MHHATRGVGRLRSPARAPVPLCAPLCLLLGCLAWSAPSAQAADLALPSAGTLLQDLKPQPAASEPPAQSPLRLPPMPEAPMPASAPFEVRQLVITGNTLFETPTLHALVARLEGQSLTLAQLNDAIGPVTAFYRQAGYPLARAIIPAQTIDNGRVTIQIIEARLGDIVLDNQSQVDTAFLQQTLSALQRGEAIRQGALDQALLLLSDVPGIVPDAWLKPGEAVGTTDLVLDIAPGPRFSGDALLDNYGSRYTGRERVGANLQWLNPLHRGDVLGVYTMSSGNLLNYARLSYEIPLNGQGSYAGAAASSLRYHLGDSAADLQAHGSAQQASLWLRSYLVRSQSGNLGVRLQYDSSAVRDDVDSTASRNHRRAELWSLELQAEAADTWFGSGYSTASVAVRTGNLGLDDAAAQSADAQTAQTQGKFTHWGAALARTQALGTGSSLAVSFNGQWAQGNLDASQKFSLGGARSVRAYESGVLSGDSGQTLTLELRQMLAVPGGTTSAGQWQAIAFWDAGQVQTNQRPWAPGSNEASISGAGVGLNWQGPRRWHGRITYSRALGSAPEQLSGSAARHETVWAEVGVAF